MNLAEGVQLISLGVLSVLVLGAALGVVLLNNIVYSAFLLGGVFISIAGIYILLNAGFVSAAQILIYVGAVNVLILYGIMLVNRNDPFQDGAPIQTRRLISAVVCAGLFALLSTVAVTTPWAISSETPIGEGATIAIGEHFFTDYLLPFELASVLLLLAMVGAIILARRDIIPDEIPTPGSQQTVLTLTERPRELVAAGTQAPDNSPKS